MRLADIVAVPDECEIFAAMEEIRSNPTKAAKTKENGAAQPDCTVSYIELSFRTPLIPSALFVSGFFRNFYSK